MNVIQCYAPLSYKKGKNKSPRNSWFYTHKIKWYLSNPHYKSTFLPTYSSFLKPQVLKVHVYVFLFQQKHFLVTAPSNQIGCPHLPAKVPLVIPGTHRDFSGNSYSVFPYCLLQSYSFSQNCISYCTELCIPGPIFNRWWDLRPLY